MTALDQRTTETTPGVERATLRQWLAVAAVALGVFAVITAELLPVGLLTDIGADLGVSAGRAGLMVTVPGLVAAATAPVSIVLAGRADRRRILLGLAVLVAGANLAAALAEDFALMLAARVLVGVTIGAFWSIAGGIAVRLVPERYVPRATAVIFGGIGAASVVGVPAGTLVGDLLGWRAAMVGLGVLALVVLAAVWVLVPPLPSAGSARFSDLPRLLRESSGVRTGLLLTFLIVAGQFIAFTYLRPILIGNGIGAGGVSGLLMVYGIAALAATFAAGALIGKRLRGTLVGLSAAIAAAMVLMALTVGDTVSAAAVLILWGLGYGLVSPAVQTWYMRAAPDRTEIATSLNTMMFNLSIAIGSWAGGVAVDTVSTTSVLWIGAALLAPVALLVARR
ncbi:MFS transporter [Glycomyces salinus]|uniref:MFS transporter n=1 Tax=Glycomyces salinus TaxID=980294 RepID=UPI0018EB5540|nr:MFS transporter [Glycomyces salinus]